MACLATTPLATKGLTTSRAPRSLCLVKQGLTLPRLAWYFCSAMVGCQGLPGTRSMNKNRLRRP